MNSIEEINAAIDNHDQRGIELTWEQQKALLYNFRALIKSKDRGLDQRAAEVARYKAAFDRIMTGGNSLASVLVGVFDAKIPPYETDFETARNKIKDPDVYDLWLCWATIMRERDSLATPPTAAVEAVEGMRKALEQIASVPCNLSNSRNCPGCVTCIARAALAAWKERPHMDSLTAIHLAAIRHRLAEANNLPCPTNLTARIQWLRYRTDVDILLAVIDEAAKVLHDAQVCITKHHDINLQRKWGALCPVCVPDEGQDIFERIEMALSAIGATAQKEVTRG